jgi:hypothetical protein
MHGFPFFSGVQFNLHLLVIRRGMLLVKSPGEKYLAEFCPFFGASGPEFPGRPVRPSSVLKTTQ